MKRLLLTAALLQASCATERYAPSVDAKVDSALTAAGLPPLAVHKLKLTGPVTIQVGQGNTTSQKKGGVPLAMYVVAALLLLLSGAAGWE
jgi:hypothetical protein